ncbi:transglutaminase domain-containing protein [Blastococcus sp. URHD0036]|uniref:transglutaminase family protein n=1 Tax=Blastococcus sp. URHD0036 TaxID=1380356 RepID=UPI00068F7669|nr:transglutaminase domain-containing protein [Blastococcus sp. URHD0036]
MSGVVGERAALAAVAREDAGATLAAAVATALGSAALAPVFSAADWVPGVLAAVAAVALSGLALRLAGPALWAGVSRNAPAPGWAALAVPLVAVGQLLALGCALTAVFASDQAVLGVIPTPGSVADLGGVLVDGSAQLREQFTPAAPLPGLCALTALMVGVVAVVVDLVAVAGRQPALAAPALLALFCVPLVTVTGGVGLAAVALPTAGLALLLWSDQHLRLTRGPRRPGGPRAATGALTAVRTALLALTAALVLGSMVPILGEGELADRWGSGSGGRSSTGTSLDPAAALQGELTREDPIDLLRVQASVPDPGYLRAVALDAYDPERGWVLDGDLGDAPSLEEIGALAPLPRGLPRRVVDATVTVLEHDDRFLPVLSSPVAVQIADAGDWSFDPASATVSGIDGTSTSEGLTYGTSGEDPRPLPEQLAGAPAVSPARPEAALADPPQLDPSVTDLVSEVTGGADTTAEVVQAIYGFMTDPANGWVYSLATDPGTTGDDLADFLQNRRGYCEQYAGAMAVMVREAGVPARVVLGYTPGLVQPDGSRLVTSNDAHAWVEVYFEGLGWVPYDPTPIDSDRAVTLPWAPRPPDQEVDPRTDIPAAPLPAPAPIAPEVDAGAEDSARAAGADDSLDWTGTVLPATAAALLGAALLAAPATARGAQRRRRLATGSAAAAWDELAATALDLGLPWNSWQTPRQIGVRLGQCLPTPPPAVRGAGPSDPAAEARAAIAYLARAEEAASFAAPGAGPAPDELAQAVHRARRGLLAAAERGTRLRALLWPASLPATVLADAGRGRGLLRRLRPSS